MFAHSSISKDERVDAIALARTDSIGAAPARSARRNGARTALTYEERD